MFDDTLDNLLGRVVHRPGHVESGRPGCGGDAVGAHTDFFQRPWRADHQTEDTDGTGDGRFIGIDAVGVH